MPRFQISDLLYKKITITHKFQYPALSVNFILSLHIVHCLLRFRLFLYIFVHAFICHVRPIHMSHTCLYFPHKASLYFEWYSLAFPLRGGGSVSHTDAAVYISTFQSRGAVHYL